MQSEFTRVYTPRDYGRMERHLDKSGECWLYVGQPSQQYPQFKAWYEKPYDRQNPKRICRVQAHVAAFEMYLGPVPPGMFVCHHCDTPPCCRAECIVPGCEHRKESPGCTSHLFIGSPADNQRDMAEKGRATKVAPPTLRGEDNPMCKLSDAHVRAIRKEYAAGGVKQWDLAHKYGVRQGIISSVILRKTHRHVE